MKHRSSALAGVALVFLSWAGADLAFGQPAPSGSREFPVGSLKGLSDLPTGQFRSRLEQLPAPAQERAVQWLRSFHFTEQDLNSLHADSEGGICYICRFTPPNVPPAAEPGTQTPPIGQAAVPVSPFPAGLKFHSRPGAPNVLFINFSGETVANTAWNTEINRTQIPAVAFSTDADRTTFSDAEQLAIKRIWQRMAEDYAPFNIDVTTERPATFGTRTAMALITRSTDANGAANPFSTAGGVAYVNVFGSASYATYRPAWIYHDNLGNVESYIAEAASHEVGHNLGLSHDGRTDGLEYYGGHGSGDISWGPLMGTGYDRNVSQWSKGEYYRASNTEDDLAMIAGKIAYRADDHGNTAGTATALVLSGGTNVVSTTPENDPANTNTVNKGVFERGTDVDVFSFVTGSGQVSLNAKPWIMPAGTRGGNLDVRLGLYNEAGILLLTNNPALQTTALIQTNLIQGRYYLHVRNSEAGSPLSATPTGYTAYGSLGQYFLSGYVVAASNFVVAPLAVLQAADITQPGQGTYQFTVSYSDDVGINVSTIGSNDVRVIGPNGYDRSAQFVSVNVAGNGTPRVATYAVQPPTGAAWLPADNGAYTVWMQTNQVGDIEGAWVPAGQLGQFNVNVAAVLYSANMDTDPGWTLEPQWQYGTPAYGSAGPAAGFTGTKIIAYNLSGNYANNLAAKYATTPQINCAGSSSTTLRFKRWLRVKVGDTVSIQASTNGTAWVSIWSNPGAVSDTAWQQVQYPIPAAMAGSPTLRLRWSLASNQSQTEIGWNLDDVELIGDGTIDTTPPAALLSVANLSTGGSPSHSCSVTYTDDSGVRLASLGATDLVVTGPNGFSNLVDFVGADLPADGSPITGIYSIAAPGGSWESTDNGTYEIVLLEDAVEDIRSNTTPRTVLGSFTVAITVRLTVTVNNLLWGSVSPTNGAFLPGSSVQLLAAPAQYYRFSQWSGGISATNNPLTIVLQTNTSLLAIFSEVFTTNYPTPHWWLASNGYTNNFENAVVQLGANRMPLWQSYIAGLNPNDPQSQLLLSGRLATTGSGVVLNWNTVTSRVYTVWSGTNLFNDLAPLAGASDLPWTINSITNTDAAVSQKLYRLQVKKP